MMRPSLVTRRDGADHYVIRYHRGDLIPVPDAVTVDRIVGIDSYTVDWDHPTRHADGRTSWPLKAAP